MVATGLFIWKTSLSDSKIVEVAKYGMTCQENFPTKPDCNPRPEYQVNEFNTQKDGYKYNYSWIVKSISKELAHILEKSLTAVYVIKNEGNLPSHHYLPCFTRKNDFEKRKDGAEKWIEEMIKRYGK